MGGAILVPYLRVSIKAKLEFETREDYLEFWETFLRVALDRGALKALRVDYYRPEGEGDGGD